MSANNARLSTSERGAGARQRPVLELSGITKRFGQLLANDDITLSLQAGQILALLGENGAGKSTLVSILFGHYVADSGAIRVFGKPLPAGDPAQALAAGIGMVHQHFTLADNLTVLENVMAGTESLWRPLSSRTAARTRLMRTATQFGLFVDPQARIGELSVGERQRVEILKALYRGARILILDEPTAVLSPTESIGLFKTLRTLVDSGLAIIFISHKLGEVLEVSDRIAVLRGGRLVANLPTKQAGRATLAQTMVGAEVPQVRRRPATSMQAGPLVTGRSICELSQVSVTEPRTGRSLLNDVNLNVHSGEIFAIAGVSGNGQQALADLLMGLAKPDIGQLRIDGQQLRAHPLTFTRAGVARIPEDRHRDGVVGELSLWENTVSERYREPWLNYGRALGGWLRRTRALRHAEQIVADFDVRGVQTAGVKTITSALSGGNMQKLILGRALSGARSAVGPGPSASRSKLLSTDSPAAAPKLNGPVLIVANQPTWGLDVGAVAYVHQQLIQAATNGAAVLLISEDLEEIFAIADTIAVIHDGQLSLPRRANDWSMSDIGLAMTGLAAKNTTQPLPL